MTTVWPINSDQDGEPVAAAALSILLFAGILTLWVPYRWAVSLFQTGAFALAIAWAVRFALRPCTVKGSLLLIPLSGALLWGMAQLTFGETVYRWETWTALLKWGTNLILFFLALQVFPETGPRRRFLRVVASVIASASRAGTFMVSAEIILILILALRRNTTRGSNWALLWACWSLLLLLAPLWLARARYGADFFCRTPTLCAASFCNPPWP